MEWLADVLWKVLYVAIVAGIAYVVQRVLEPILKRFLEERPQIPAASIFVNILRAIIWSCAVLSVLEPVFGIDPSGFVTALGVASVALSLGLQDTISNLIGGLSLMAGKVIEPGDEVEIDGTAGRVTDVNWRSTTVTTRTGVVKVIPNSVLNTSALTHRIPFDVGLVTVEFEVAQNADLDMITHEVTLLANLAIGEDLDPDFQTLVRFYEIGAYGTKGKVLAHVKEGVFVAVAADKIVRAIQGKPWLATCVNTVPMQFGEEEGDAA